MKKTLELGALLDTAASPTAAGYPQRGARPPKPKAERRSDQLSTRIKPSLRAMIEQIAYEEGISQAELFEKALFAYVRKHGGKSA